MTYAPFPALKLNCICVASYSSGRELLSRRLDCVSRPTPEKAPSELARAHLSEATRDLFDNIRAAGS